MSPNDEAGIEGRYPDGEAEVEYLKSAPNGVVSAMGSEMTASSSPPASNGGRMMEVDDDSASFAEETEIFLQRDQHYRRAGEYPPVSLPHRTSRPYDAVTISSTRSLHDRDLDYEEENGRRYVVSYHLPNDDDEQLRMQIIHQVHLTLFDFKLTAVPLLDPIQILDIGTGTGDWAIGIGEEYPECEVTGIDLSAIQPSAVPSNVFFEIFDGEDDDDWTYPEECFDLIHFRNMNGSIKSWERICQRVYTHLQPGGWIEIVDFKDQMSQFASCFKKDSEVQTWFKAMDEAAQRLGKDISTVDAQMERLNRIGFKDVEITTKDLPMGLWPEDSATKNVAKLWLVASLAGLEAMSLRPLTQELGWAPDEVRRMCSLIERELKSIAMDEEKARSLTSTVQVIVGQRPFAGSLKADEQDEEENVEVDELQPEGKRLRFSRSIDRGSRDMSASIGDKDHPGRDLNADMS